MQFHCIFVVNKGRYTISQLGITLYSHFCIVTNIPVIIPPVIWILYTSLKKHNFLLLRATISFYQCTHYVWKYNSRSNTFMCSTNNCWCLCSKVSCSTLIITMFWCSWWLSVVHNCLCMQSFNKSFAHS